MKRNRFSLANLFEAENRGIVLFIAVILVALLLLQVSFFDSGRLFLQRKLYGVGNGIFTLYSHIYTKKAELEVERNHYRYLAQQLSVDRIRLAELEGQVRELERLLTYKETTKNEAIVAKVLSRSSEDEHMLLIDKGSSDLLTVGRPVIVEQGHLLGIVDQVGNHTATVRLLTDKQTKIPGALATRGQTTGIVEGQNGYFLNMSLIPKSELVQIGDLIATTGAQSHVPSGLIIGVVREVSAEENSSFQTATVEPLVDARRYNTVLVLLPPNESL